MNILKKLSEKSKNYGAFAPVKIALLGDSITQGCFEIFNGPNGIECIYDYEAVYHSQLRRLLNGVFPSVPVSMINAGVSGSDAKLGLERIERDILCCMPDLVVVCFGLNDITHGINGLDRYARALDGIFKKLNANGIETVFMTPNMMNTYVSPQLSGEFSSTAGNTAEIQNSGIMDKYMVCAVEICNNNRVPICDCYKKWKHLHENGIDTTRLLANYINHPAREMHRLFASSLFEKMIW